MIEKQLQNKNVKTQQNVNVKRVKLFDVKMRLKIRAKMGGKMSMKMSKNLSPN